MTRRIVLAALLGCLPLAAGSYDLMVQGAVDGELQPLIAALESRKEVRKGIWSFWTGRIGRIRVVVSRTDVGPINAVGATMEGIRAFRPRLVINQGTAGAHSPELRLWDIVVGERTVDYGAYKSTHGDSGTGIQPRRWTPVPHKLRTKGAGTTDYPWFAGAAGPAESALKVKNPRGRVVKGVIGSAYQFNRELDYIQEIRRLFGTDSEDMESAFAAGAAEIMGVPFVAVRIISDSEWNHPTFERIAGKYCAEFVLDWIRRGVAP